MSAEPAPSGLTAARIARLLRPHPWLTLAHAAAIIIAVVASIALAAVWKGMFDDAIPGGDRRLLMHLVMAALGLLLITALMCAARAWIVGAQTARVLEEVRSEMKQRLLGQPFSYFSKVSIGDDVARFTGDVNALETLFTIGLPNLVMGAALGVGSLVYMVVLDWRLALLTLLVVPLATVGPKLLGNAVNRAGAARLRQEADFANTVKEAIATQPVIPLFGLTRHWLMRSNAQLAELRARTQRMIGLSQLSGFSTIVGVSFGTVAVVSGGAVLAMAGYTTVGALLGFFTLLLNLTAAAALVGAAVPEMAKANGGLQRIDALLSLPPIVEAEGPASLPRLSEAITFRGLAFTYPGAEERSIDGLDLTIRRGETVAFVGPSGSGKSTVLKLLMRLYEPELGSIEWDGQPLAAVPRSAHWANLGVVLQETTLFDSTIRENIRLGRLDASDAEIEAAAKAAGLDELVQRLPRGYDTPVGEGGGRLSGGQRQRVAIARALVRDPDVLVLDEITAALDPATEAEVNRAIEGLRGARVIVSVTHRLKPITSYDKIFVLDAGRLAEAGDHASLIEAGGIYADLFGRQEGLSLTADGYRAEVEVGTLGRVPLLAGLDRAHLERLARRFVSERCSGGMRLFAHGEPGDRFYLIARGAVELSVPTEGGGERVAAVLHEGDFFGEIALMRDMPRTATATARGECVFLSLSRDDFAELLAGAPEVAAVVEKEVAQRLASPLKG